MTGTEDILSLIPQRPPFVMVDELLYSDDRSSKTRFRVAKENILVEHGKLSEAGLVENIAQTAAAGAGNTARKAGVPVMLGYIGAIKNLEVFALPAIDDVLETEVVIENQIFDVRLVMARTKCNDQVIAQCQMKVFIIDPNKLKQS